MERNGDLIFAPLATKLILGTRDWSNSAVVVAVVVVDHYHGKVLI